MQPIIVPTINSNDTDALLLSWSKADGESVSAGETIAVLETTKATFDLAAEGDGVLQTDAQAQQRCNANVWSAAASTQLWCLPPQSIR